ncbi:hypothetical protein [Oceanithermus sp.]
MLPSSVGDETRASPAFRANASAWVERITAFRQALEEVRRGGGERAVERQHEKGRLTTRERIARLVYGVAPFNGLMNFICWAYTGLLISS